LKKKLQEIAKLEARSISVSEQVPVSMTVVPAISKATSAAHRKTQA